VNTNPHSETRLIGESDAMRALHWEIECAARSSARVLITGESGVGKEVVARLIHRRSQRNKSPLITINCAGVPDSLLESELFGHVRGSFTAPIGTGADGSSRRTAARSSWMRSAT
jgi:transcriptional regulator with GAF, ATPase, and Fis domain